MTIQSELTALQAEVRQLRKQWVGEPVRHEKPLGGGGAVQYVVYRRLPSDDPTGVGDTLMCSKLSWNGTAWALPSSAEVEMKVEPGLIALVYGTFAYPGTGAESYPLVLPAGAVALPMFVASGRQTVLHHSKIYYGTAPDGMPITEGIITNGQGVVRFAS